MNTNLIDNIIIELYPTGATYNKIADQIASNGYEISRKAISGRISRMLANNKLNRRELPKREKKLRASHTIVVKSYERIELKDWKEFGNPDDAVSLMDLTHSMCRFPFENSMYCGHELKIGSYCEKHAKICYTGNGKKLR